MTNYAQNVHTATGPGTVKHDAGVGNTFGAFSMRVVSPAPNSTVNLETSPDGTTWTPMGTVTGDGWVTALSNHRQRQARANCTALGTGGSGLSSIVCCTP